MSALIKISHSTFTVTIATPAVFTRVAHGLSVGDVVYFETTGALPTGLVVGTAYYVIATGLTADAFQVSATEGGAAINTTGTQNGTHTLVVDRTEKVEYDSVDVARALTSQIDTSSFEVVVKETTDWRPTLQDDVKILEDTDVIFAGTLIEMDEVMRGGDVQVIRCRAKDYSFDFDRELVANVYENTTVQAAIEDIVDNYTTGFTYNNVVAAGSIDYLAFKYEYPSKCLQQLAELIGYDWYIDENKDVHFFAKESVTAPFDLDDTGGKYYFDTLKVKHDVKNLRNTIIVRGGTYLGNSVTEEIVADGDQITFLWAYKYSNAVFKIDGGAALNVGIDFIDDPTSYDALYNFNEKALKFPSGSQPTSGEVVSVTGDPHIPVIVRVKDPVAIAEHGAFEYKVVDKSINSKEGARDRAQAELRGWADEIHEGAFETKEAGLKVGMAITVASTLRGINQDYIINRITSKLINGSEWRHKVSLITTQTFGMMEFLQRLLIQKDKEIVIDENEVVDLVESYFETISIGETVVTSLVHNTQLEEVEVAETATVRALDYAVEFVAGETAPSSTKRQFILDGSPLG